MGELIVRPGSPGSRRMTWPPEKGSENVSSGRSKPPEARKAYTMFYASTPRNVGSNQYIPKL
jgi:hypothetical protein